jgi:hypothetical protein
MNKANAVLEKKIYHRNQLDTLTSLDKNNLQFIELKKIVTFHEERLNCGMETNFFNENINAQTINKCNSNFICTIISKKGKSSF